MRTPSWSSKFFNFQSLFPTGLPDNEKAAMELGLAHSPSRYKLKFSPNMIDTMIVQVREYMVWL
jgi:RNA processing factor Prp31